MCETEILTQESLGSLCFQSWPYRTETECPQCFVVMLLASVSLNVVRVQWKNCSEKCVVMGG